MIKRLLILFLVLLTGCVNEEEKQIVKVKYQQFLSDYDYYYPKLQDDKGLNNFKSYLKISYEDDFIQNDEVDLSIEDGSLLKIEADHPKWYKGKIKTTIDLNREVMYHNFCEEIQGIKFSKDYLFVIEYGVNDEVIIALKELIEKESDAIASLYPSEFGRKSINHSDKNIVIYKYSKNKLSLLCKKNIPSDQNSLVLHIMKLIENYLAKHNDLKFDHALIPLEIKKSTF